MPKIRTLIKKSRDLHVYKTGLDGMIDWNEKQKLEQKKPEKRNQNGMSKSKRPDLFPIDYDIKKAQDTEEYLLNEKLRKITSDFPSSKEIEEMRKREK